MKQITLNIPSSSIDQELYQYDGLYRENQLISKELDQDIVQNITFENDAPVNFKIKTTPYLTYESFLPETEHNLFSIQRIKSIITDQEISIFPKNDKAFVIKKVAYPEINISTFVMEDTADNGYIYNRFFKIDQEALGYNFITRTNYPPQILNIIGQQNTYGLNGLLLTKSIPLFFASTVGQVDYPAYTYISSNGSAYIMSNAVNYATKDNTKLDGTYENIALTPPNDQIGKPNIKLVQTPLFLTEVNIQSQFQTETPLFYILNFPVYDHDELYTYKSGFGLESGKKCVGYYPLSQENNAVRLAFFDKTYNTKNDKSSSFYDIDLENSTFGIQMPTESKMLSVKISTHTTEHAQTYDMPLDVITGAQFNKWPSEKNGKPSHVIFQPDIKVKPKTATVNVKVEFNFADAEMTSEAKEGIKNALILNMIDGEWNLATPQKSFEGIIADPIA